LSRGGLVFGEVGLAILGLVGVIGVGRQGFFGG